MVSIILFPDHGGSFSRNDDIPDRTLCGTAAGRAVENELARRHRGELDLLVLAVRKRNIETKIWLREIIGPANGADLEVHRVAEIHSDRGRYELAVLDDDVKTAVLRAHARSCR